jgi:hypothetical protein
MLTLQGPLVQDCIQEYNVVDLGSPSGQQDQCRKTKKNQTVGSGLENQYYIPSCHQAYFHKLYVKKSMSSCGQNLPGL